MYRVCLASHGHIWGSAQLLMSCIAVPAKLKGPGYKWSAWPKKLARNVGLNADAMEDIKVLVEKTPCSGLQLCLLRLRIL